jgi:spermidine/putrescine transport system substrate-binding protein
MDFLLEPENIAQVTNYAQYAAGITGAPEFTEEALANSPENNPREGAGPGVFIEVCDQATQEVYDRIWTRLRS